MPKAKVLLLDIETSPNVGYTWSKWETNVVEFVKEWQILSIAFKWLGEKTVMTESQQDLTERQLVKKIHTLLDYADIVVAHNGNSFDLKKIRAKFLEYGLKPPSPYKQVDTKLAAKAAGSFNSNSLDDLGRTLKLGRKAPTGGFETWVGCMKGDAKAWSKMLKYNRQDVLLLEKIYLKLRPYMRNHPALDIINCPSCGSPKMQRRGASIAARKKRERLQCQGCGTWSQGRVVK